MTAGVCTLSRRIHTSPSLTPLSVLFTPMKEARAVEEAGGEAGEVKAGGIGKAKEAGGEPQTLNP
jgi:hypothetical protein